MAGNKKQIPSMLERYAYQPLESQTNSIRLVAIEPAEYFDDPVVCHLSHVNFGNKPQYYALSYQWGQQTSKKTIALDSVNFEVGANLFDALRYLRSRDEMVPFWIDAICIDQSSISERSR